MGLLGAETATPTDQDDASDAADKPSPGTRKKRPLGRPKKKQASRTPQKKREKSSDSLRRMAGAGTTRGENTAADGGEEAGEHSGWITTWKDEWVIEPPNPVYSAGAIFIRQLARRASNGFESGPANVHAQARVVAWCRDRRQAVVIPARSCLRSEGIAELKRSKLDWSNLEYHLSVRLRIGQSHGKQRHEEPEWGEGEDRAPAGGSGAPDAAAAQAEPSAVLTALQCALGGACGPWTLLGQAA